MARPRSKPLEPGTLERSTTAIREEGILLLAEGYSARSVAGFLGVILGTVREWARSNDGQAAMEAARAKRAETIKAGAARALDALRSFAPTAAQVLIDQTQSTDPGVAVRAASQILDRVGVIRSEGYAVSAVAITSLDALTPDQIAELRRLRAIALGPSL